VAGHAQLSRGEQEVDDANGQLYRVRVRSRRGRDGGVRGWTPCAPWRARDVAPAGVSEAPSGLKFSVKITPSRFRLAST
jgi:hypothetical protein